MWKTKKLPTNISFVNSLATFLSSQFTLGWKNLSKYDKMNYHLR